MASVVEPQFPVAARPRTKPDGSPYTVDDKEYWLLEKDGGIRRHQHFDFPAMRYRGMRGENGKVVAEQRIVQTEREDEAAQAEGWCLGPDLAIEAFDAMARDVSRAAAETAYAATKLTDKAQREYQKRSAASADHITQ